MTPWTVAYQAPPSVGFSRQEFGSELPFLSPGDLPDPGIEPRSPALSSEPPGKSLYGYLSPMISFNSNYLLTPDAFTLGVKSSTNGEGNTVQSMARSPFDGTLHATGKKVRNLGTQSKQNTQILRSRDTLPGQEALSVLHTTTPNSVASCLWHLWTGNPSLP